MEDKKEYTAVELLDFEAGTLFKDTIHGVTVEVVEIGLNNKYLEGGLTKSTYYLTTNLLARKFIKIDDQPNKSKPLREYNIDRHIAENGKEHLVLSEIEQTNYEEEYKKLKAENEQLKRDLDGADQAISNKTTLIKDLEGQLELKNKYVDGIRHNYEITIEDLRKSNDVLKKRIIRSEAEVEELKTSLNDAISQNNNYGYLEDRYKKLTNLVVKLVEVNELLAANVYVEGLED